jgi:hypothetical protein
MHSYCLWGLKQRCYVLAVCSLFAVSVLAAWLIQRVPLASAGTLPAWAKTLGGAVELVLPHRS